MIRNLDITHQPSSDSEIFQELAARITPPAVRRPELDFNEQTREETLRLVRQVFFSGPAVPQVVIFSAVERGSGCTSVCARAAETLAAHVDGLVCIVDADLRAPSLHQYFEIETPSDALNEEFLAAPVRKKTQPIGRSNLWLLCSSAAETDMQSPQQFERLRSRVSDLRNDFTYVLIDAPPINAYADAALLGEVADGLVMILEANDTRREAALRAKETLGVAGIRLLGAVLNKRTYPIPEKLYRKL